MFDELLKTVSGIERKVDLAAFNVKKNLGLLEPLEIQPYTGYGTAREVFLKGRVIEFEKGSAPSKGAPFWENAYATFRRLESGEIPFVRVKISLQGEEHIVRTDEEGFFDVRMQLSRSLPSNRNRHTVKFELLDNPVRNSGAVTAEGKVIVPGASAEFGVISDVDDTILVSRSREFIESLQILFLNNAYTRKPFPGIAAFYRALQAGKSGSAFNPIFYVSRSPWNLYDLLEKFCRTNGVPEGPFFMQDLGLSKDTFIAKGHYEQKAAAVERILATYPDLPFILIGDSGEKDPETYLKLVRRFPGRIRAVYIRNVTGVLRELYTRYLADECDREGVPMVLAESTLRAAEHAVRKGFVDSAALDDIRNTEAADEMARGSLEQVFQ